MDRINLNSLRKEIDEIDRELVQLIERRFNLVLLVGKYKKENKLPILDENREEKVLEKCKSYLLNSKYQPYLNKLYIELMNICKDLQKINIVD